MLYRIIKNRYALHLITAADVWAYADENKITAAQAETICGPRPVTPEA